MREIKFRAWDKNNQKMWTWKEILQAWGSLDIVEIITGEKGFALMQYTGLKDKNGKEIWEGDVVVLPDSEITPITDDGQGPEEYMNHLSPVEFKGGCFGLNVLEDSGIFHKGFWSFDSILNGEGYKLKDLEVIGDVYQNPEFIK